MTVKKQIVRMECEMNVSIGTLEWTIPGHESVLFRTERTSQANQRRAMMLGFKQTVANCAAMVSGSTWAEKRAAMVERRDWLEQGNENWTTTGGERGPSAQVMLLARAYSERKTVELTEALAWVRAKTPDEQAWLRNADASPLKPLCEKLVAAQVAQSKIDVAGMLEELGEVADDDVDEEIAELMRDETTEE